MTETTVRRLIVVLVACAACSSPTASTPAPTQGALMAQLRSALDGFESEPSRQDLLRLAEEETLTTALVAIYEDPSELLLRRIRALTSLRHLSTSRARASLEQAVRDAGTPDAIRRAAVKAYAEAFKTDAVAALSTALNARDLHTREAAIRSLGEIGSPQAREVLRRHRAVESEPSVRGTLDKIVAAGSR